MGLGQDAKDLILGNDGSDKEPVDFKTELQNAIKAGLITKADGTLLITSRTNCDKLADLIARAEEKEVTAASKESGREYEEGHKKEEKAKEDKRRQDKVQKDSLEQQIQASQNATKAKMEAEKQLAGQKERDNS